MKKENTYTKEKTYTLDEFSSENLIGFRANAKREMVKDERVQREVDAMCKKVKVGKKKCVLFDDLHCAYLNIARRDKYRFYADGRIASFDLFYK